MTIALSGADVALKLKERFPEAVLQASGDAVLLKSGSVFQVAQFLKESPDFAFDYLSSINGVDYLDYFEVVYQLTSTVKNQSLVLKTRCYGRQNLSVPSVVGLWRGADFQEREIYDLLGIAFEGHPDMRRIVLWEGFQGHPLRKDYL